MDFPVKVFEDIEGSDFEKHNKKQVTEDFVTENFKEIGWSVYRPASDTGIDLIAIKRMCPKNHTKMPKDLIWIQNFEPARTKCASVITFQNAKDLLFNKDTKYLIWIQDYEPALTKCASVIPS